MITAPGTAIANPGYPSVSAVRVCAQGEIVHDIGASGAAWRVQSGTVRLDAAEDGSDTLVFASLAMPSDIVGAEAMLFHRYHFRATAMTPTVLIPWPTAPEPQVESVLGAMVRAEASAAKVVALRAGTAIERMSRLIQLLASVRCGEAYGQFALPSLRDMADITNLTHETVSRCLNGLRRQGLLEFCGRRTGRGVKTANYLAT